jgi:dTDP-4-amino-4,6-dideoxygalactose transaminase
VPDRIPFVGLDRDHALLAQDLQDALTRVHRTGAFILGRELESFETEFAAYCGVEHCVGVGSGTAALALAFMAAGIGRGDEVIVPAHTYIASALGVVHAGATPVFCDVHEGTGLIDLDAAAAAVTERTAAILPVHLYGQLCDGVAAAEFADRHGIAVIEDAAQAHGASRDGVKPGGRSRAACFSFYPSKNLGALGDGGAVCTNDADLAQRVRELRHLGQRSKGEHVVAGFNERLDGLQAAFLRVKLPYLDGWNAARRDHAAAFREALGGALRLLQAADDESCVYHLFPVRVDDRDALGAVLAEDGIDTGVHYSPSVPEQPPFRVGAVGEFPAAEAWARDELSLPMFPSITADERERVIDACLRHLATAQTR